MKPFIKWVGGKSRLLPEIRARLPKDFNRVVEPFVGGGAFMFDQEDKDAVICDYNWQLAKTYEMVREHPEVIIQDLSSLPVNKETYLEVRAHDPYELDDLNVATRLIYLNKVGFNGMWRENKQGKFNVPFSHSKAGKDISELVSFEQITFASKRLQGVLIEAGDFTQALVHAKEGDFVFFDPPYIDTWDGYANDGDSFAEADQKRLRNALDELDSKGIKFMLTNSYNDTTKELYKGYRQEETEVSYTVGGKNASRDKRSEIIVRNY